MSKKISFKQKHVARPPRGQPWVWITADLLASRVWQTRSRNCIRLIDRLMLEHLAHAGKENGRLAVSYDQFVEFGIGRRFISDAIEEAEDRGLIEVTFRGFKLKEAPSRYRLSFFATSVRNERGAYEWSAPTDDWRGRENRFLGSPLSRKTAENLPKGELTDGSAAPSQPAEMAESLDFGSPDTVSKGGPSNISCPATATASLPDGVLSYPSSGTPSPLHQSRKRSSP